MKFHFPCTENQVRMLTHPARILWCGTGTKTGKSAASYAWLIEGMLQGEACCFVGPWFFRSRRAFDECKLLLEPFIRSRQVRVNESRLQITSSSGGFCDFQSADNSDALFGGNYHRLVLDESSRMPEAIQGAALTTISATNGKLRLFFNLELGTKNWSIRNLLRVQRLSAAERAQSGEDFLTFPTDPALVDPAMVANLRMQMPEPLWRALYLAEIPDSDCSLFRNLDAIFSGRELEQPIHGVEYYLAADVARKKDWSVITIIDDRGHVVACDRFNQISWALQVERAAMWYRTFNCRKAIVDGTGVGDVIAEEFEKAGMNVEAFIFTVPSRRLLVEELVVACDNREIVLPATEKFRTYRTEMDSMEFQLDGSSIKYAVPSGSHDDCLFSLALATHIYRASRGFVLGLLDLLKRTAKEIAEGLRDAAGDLIRKPVPVAFLPKVKPKIELPPVVVDNFRIWLNTNHAPKCPACQNAATTYNAAHRIFCNQCHAVDGVAPAASAGACCGAYLPQAIPNGTRCRNCGFQTMSGVACISRAAYARGTRRTRSFGRF